METETSTTTDVALAVSGTHHHLLLTLPSGIVLIWNTPEAAKPENSEAGITHCKLPFPSKGHVLAVFNHLTQNLYPRKRTLKSCAYSGRGVCMCT